MFTSYNPENVTLFFHSFWKFFLNMDLFDLTDDEDFVEVINVIRNVRRQPQNYRNRPDHFVIWNDDEFLNRFRFTKQGVRFITEQIAPQITSATEQ